MKQYTVYFILEKGNHGYMNQNIVKASSEENAIELTKEQVKENTGLNAFMCSCESPVKSKKGLQYKGVLFTKYDKDCFNVVW